MSVVSRSFALVAVPAATAWLGPLLAPIAALLAASYSVVGSYGAAIIVFSVVITMMTLPFTVWGWRSQIAMRRLQPQLNELRRRTRGDKQRFAAESSALFQAHGISPLGAFLPALLPLPLLLAVYQVIRDVTSRRAASAMFVARHVPRGSRLWRALTSASVMRSWGIDLAQTGGAALHASPAAIALCLGLMAIVIVAGVWQQRLTLGIGRTSNDGVTTATKSSQYLSGLIVLWGFGLPLAVLLYYATSSVVRLGQQWLLLRLHPG